ncbi:MAG TPA: zf-HC2 domain-containing protein [Vicinamibacterales bacterium]|nr:zf-HC2 domain-containing protein [Vicinamibacterales bacterium]
MSSFNCDDKQTLIAYLYDEVDTATRDRVNAHIASCARCAAEVRALGDVRLELSRWAPPDAELGFAIVRTSEQESARILHPAQWWQTVPAWARAAAAVLVLAAGAAIANIQVRSNVDGFVVTTGWMAPALSEPSASEPGGLRVEGPANDEWRTALASLEQQLRSEIRSPRDSDVVRVAAAPADQATLRRVQQMIAASEARQERELALLFAQFAREMDVQRTADLQRIRSVYSVFDEQMFRQQQMLNNINNVIRISGTPQQ